MLCAVCCLLSAVMTYSYINIPYVVTVREYSVKEVRHVTTIHSVPRRLQIKAHAYTSVRDASTRTNWKKALCIRRCSRQYSGHRGDTRGTAALPGTAMTRRAKRRDGLVCRRAPTELIIRTDKVLRKTNRYAVLFGIGTVNGRTPTPLNWMYE